MQNPDHKLSVQELADITERTLDHYNQRATAFWEGTRSHDVSQNIKSLLKHIEVAAPFSILDVGCGPGRDLKTFIELGHQPVGLDGSAEFAQMARDYAQCEVWQQ